MKGAAAAAGAGGEIKAVVVTLGGNCEVLSQQTAARESECV